MDLSSGEKIRRIVFNYADEETAIIGAEAFMAPVDSTELTLGFFSSDDIGFADLDLGFRFDRIERDGFIAEVHEDEHHEEGHDDHDDDQTTTMTTTTTEITMTSTMKMRWCLNLSPSTRVPSAQL